jgi:predicted ATPase
MIDNVVILKLDVLHIEDESSKPEGLRTDGTNFAAAYRRIRETDFERTAKLHEALKTVIGGFKSLDQVDVSSETTRLVVRLFMAKDGSTYPLRFKNLSDGQRALTVLYALTTTFDLKNRPLFIDEPDNFVSLRELQPWLQSLTQAVADEGAQATIVSHSPEVIDYLASDHAWLFERDDGGPSRVRPLSIDLDAGMKASEQLARGWVRGA